MMKKKILALIFALVMILSLSACGEQQSGEQSQGSEEGWPKKSITILCPWSAGGGSDLAIRSLVPYLEKELNTSITVENVTGANGWIAWTQLLDSNPDGYTIAQLNIPAFYSGYLDRAQGREDVTLDSFTPLCNEISDWGCLVVKHGDNRFSNAQEFVAYAKEHEMIAGDSGAGSQKHLLCEMINDQQGLKLTALHQSGWSDTYAALLGGHIDVGWGSVGECLQGYQDGEVDVLCVFAPERSALLPDVPTFTECGFDELLSPADRGFVAPAGVSEDILAIYDTAFEKAISDPNFIADMKALGQEVNFMGRTAYTEYCRENEAIMLEYARIMDWDVG